MSNFNKPLIIAPIATAIIALPVFLLDIQFSNATTLASIFIVSLSSALLATRTSKPRARRQVDENRIPYNQSKRENGSVKWFNASKGFGFITRDSGDDIFVHFRSIRGEGHRVLHDGQRVEFAISEGDKGLQAEDVAVAK